MRPRAVGVLVVGAVLLAGTGVMVGRSTSAATQASAPAVTDQRTEKVSRRTLTRTSDVDGMLGYGELAALSLNLPGMLTWLPEIGSTIDRGEPIARVDDRPVVALLGSVPVYRPLTVGMRGSDVRQLKDNLDALGYRTDTGDRYTTATASAVRAWQSKLGLARTGEVTAGWATVLGHPVRVAGHTAQPGMPASGAILQTTGTDRLVTASLAVAKQDLAVIGRKVAIGLPGGGTAMGRITSVGPPQLPEADPAEAVDLKAATVAVTIRIKGRRIPAGLDLAPVVVTFAAEERRDVLAVPVNALLALPGGGYGVEVLDGTTTRTVPVTTGLFADGVVEISGSDPGTLEESDRVVVPS